MTCYYKLKWVDERDMSEADVSLTLNCLATCIWTLAPRAISGSKTRGTSLDTTVWPHVQVLRSFSYFYANRVIWALFCSLEQKTRTSTTAKQTKHTKAKNKKQEMRKSNLVYWNVTQQELKIENKTSKTKTVAGSSQCILNEKLGWTKRLSLRSVPN